MHESAEGEDSKETNDVDEIGQDLTGEFLPEIEDEQCYNSKLAYHQHLHYPGKMIGVYLDDFCHYLRDPSAVIVAMNSIFISCSGTQAEGCSYHI